MDKLQFNFEEDSLYSPLSPDVIDISSGSEDAFSIAPGNTQQLEEKFRVNPAGSNLMAAFVGSSLATLYPNSTVPQGNHETTVAGGSQIEKNLMELMSDPGMNPQIPRHHSSTVSLKKVICFPGWTTEARPRTQITMVGHALE